MAERDHGFTRSVRRRLGILAVLLLLGVWGDTRPPAEEEGARPDRASDRVGSQQTDQQGHQSEHPAHPARPAHDNGLDGADDAIEVTLETLGMTRDGVMAALGDDMVWQEADGEEDTWIGTGDWTYVVLTGNPLDLSGVHMYHKVPEYAGGISPAEQEQLHQRWREDSLLRAQGFVHRLLPEWRFDELQAWTAETAAGFEHETCDPYCLDFTLVMDRIVMLSEYPDETLSVGLFSLGEFLYASAKDEFAPGLDVSIDDILAGLSVGDTFVLQATPEFEDGLPVFTGVDRVQGTRVEFKGNPLNLRHVTLSLESADTGRGARTVSEAPDIDVWLTKFVAAVVPDQELDDLAAWLSQSLARTQTCEFCSPAGLVVDEAIELRLTRAGETWSISAQALGP